MDTEKLRILPRPPEPTYPGQVVRVPIEPPVYHELALAVRDLQEAPPAVRRFVRFAREWFSAREERKRGLNFFRVICEKNHRRFGTEDTNCLFRLAIFSVKV